LQWFPTEKFGQSCDGSGKSGPGMKKPVRAPAFDMVWFV